MMSDFVIIIIIIVIAGVAISSSRRSKPSRKGTSVGPASTNHHHRCPYCGTDYGWMSSDRAVCSNCKRMYVMDRATTAAEQATIRQETSDVALVNSGSFPLFALEQLVADVFYSEGKYLQGTGASKILGVEFGMDHLDLVLYYTYPADGPLKKSAFNYPALRSEAGRHALTAACFNYLKANRPYCNVEIGDFTITRM